MEIDLKINKNKTNLRNFDTDKKKTVKCVIYTGIHTN